MELIKWIFAFENILFMTPVWLLIGWLIGSALRFYRNKKEV